MNTKLFEEIRNELARKAGEYSLYFKDLPGDEKFLIASERVYPAAWA